MCHRMDAVQARYAAAVALAAAPIENQMRVAYNRVVREPLPEDIKRLVEELEKKS